VRLLCQSTAVTHSDTDRPLTRPPQAILLLGPFVDSEHPSVDSGTADLTYEAMYKELLLARLARWARQEQYQGKILLLPSTRDVHHQLVFPQHPLAVPSSDSASATFVALQNPASVALNGVLVASSSQDVLRHLGPSELAIGPCPVDRLSALCAHMLGQRSLYPLYPPPREVPLDTTMDEFLVLQHTPDLLLLPSDFAPFAKMVAADGGVAGGAGIRKVVCVNPGRLAKGSGGGTYARVLVGAGQAPVEERCCVEVVRV
jgi:DNA polymerase alpha subunit B